MTQILADNHYIKFDIYLIINNIKIRVIRVISVHKDF